MFRYGSLININPTPLCLANDAKQFKYLVACNFPFSKCSSDQIFVCKFLGSNGTRVYFSIENGSSIFPLYISLSFIRHKLIKGWSTQQTYVYLCNIKSRNQRSCETQNDKP